MIVQPAEPRTLLTVTKRWIPMLRPRYPEESGIIDEASKVSMSVAAELTPDWKHWEGEIVDGVFPLTRFLGVGGNGAVFLTRLGSGDAAIKLVSARDTDATELVARWSRAANLEHPHLVKILKTGTWTREGRSFAYVVTEYAEENLAGVLAERALSSDEVLEMLPPMADVLMFLHSRGYALGGLKPSRVLAVEDTLKLASDAVSTGDAALDVRSLAGIVVEALTQKKVTEADRTGLESLPEPFRAIVRNCLGQNGRSQWSAADLASWLRTQKGTEPKTVTHAAQAGTRKISLTSSVVALLLALVAVITIGSLWRNRHPAAAPPASQTPTPVVGSPAPVASPPQQPPPPAQVLAEPIQPAAKVPELKRQRATAAALPADVVRQALPEIPAKARRTIRGKATVLVKVVANENGEVTDAVAEPGSSRYFSQLATDAARKWRFASSGDASRKYLVRFEITRGETKTSVERSAE